MKKDVHLPLSVYVGSDMHCATWPSMTSNDTTAKQICDVVVDETMMILIKVLSLHTALHQHNSSSLKVTFTPVNILFLRVCTSVFL